MTKPNCGVYCVENIQTGKKYIGQSIDLRKRKLTHFSKLRRLSHPNHHLQNAWNKYGEGNFEFKILIYCEPFELTKYEQFFVDSCAPEHLYNARLESVDSNFGFKHSKKSIEKMSGNKNHNWGIPMSEEQKIKISDAQIGDKNHMYGKHHGGNTKMKISNALKGENSYWYGKKFSEDMRQKMSVAHSGKVVLEDTRKKLSKASLGRKSSEQTKKKISDNRIGQLNPMAKLTESDVLNIYAILKEKPASIKDIANMYNVSCRSISSIKTGARWKHLYHNFREEVT